ncbi:hypothetical protein ACHHYP_04250 [Achlya hypogyna]|uniref:Uncharacterized protein n=1 Tax=Achlya hypogyna TaxID=1202772 RepID=A0A1V9Z1S9_ACHHY|nr:hypothetical protein ACHHYP_04250 [Achlya hypogyna]
MAWTIAFMKDDCTCNASSLFNLKYLRTHRAGSVKYIRCFPHCCPEHSFTNFCTTSLGIRVSNVAQETPDDPGQEIAQSTVHGDVRSLANPKGDWIPSHMGQYNAQLRELSFRFNHNNSVGWHYGWMGTSTKAHRTCTHHLVAYILRPVGHGAFRVVAMQPSPPFIVMSYRRACFYCQKHKPSEARPANCDGASCHCEGEFNVSEGVLPPPPAPMPPLPAAAPRMPQPPAPRQLSVVECQLAIMHYFAQELPASAFVSLPRGQTVVQAQVLAPLQRWVTATWGQSTGPDGVFPPLARVTTDGSSTLEATQLMIVDVLGAVVDFFLSTNATLFGSYTQVLFNRDQLFEAYTSWLAELHAVVAARLSAAFDASVPQLVAQIVQLAGQSDSLGTVHAKIHLLNSRESQPSVGFDYFVAQLREVYLATEPLLPAPSSTPFSRRWIYTHTVGHSYAMGGRDPSLLTIARAALSCYAFEARLDGTIFSVSSAVAIYRTIPAVFELDGVGHVFRVYPHGESSLCLLAGRSHGDYVGTIGDDTIDLRIYCWPAGDDDLTAYVLQLTLAADDEALDMTVTLVRATLPTLLDISTSTAASRIKAYAAGARDESTIAKLHAVYAPHTTD